jgi:hypothetical protein
MSKSDSMILSLIICCNNVKFVIPFDSGIFIKKIKLANFATKCYIYKNFARKIALAGFDK